MIYSFGERDPGPHNAHKGILVDILTFWRGLCKYSGSGPWLPLSLVGCWGLFTWNQTKTPRAPKDHPSTFPPSQIYRWDPERESHLPKVTQQRKSKNQSPLTRRPGAAGPPGPEPPCFLLPPLPWRRTSLALHGSLLRRLCLSAP